MPETQTEATPEVKAPIANQTEDAFGKLDLPEDVKQALGEVEAEEKEAEPELKTKTDKSKPEPGEETLTDEGQEDSVQKVFIKGEKGEELEANLEDVIKDALQIDSIKVVDGKAVIDFVADGKTYQNVDIPKVVKWAQMGVNANRIIEKANNSIALAESAIADNKRQVEYSAEQMADQKVARIIDSLNRGYNPITNEPLDEEQKQGAQITASQLANLQYEKRLKMLEEQTLRQNQNLNQRQQQERDRTLRGEAQAKLETVFTPFTQYFKADGKPLDGLLARFKDAVSLQVAQKTREYRSEIGPEPDIPTDWVRDTAKESAKLIFKDYYPLLNKPVSKEVPKPKKALVPSIKAGSTSTKTTPTRSLSWDQEREMIERELGYKK